MRVLVSVLVIIFSATIAFAVESEDHKKEETTTQLNLADDELQEIKDGIPLLPEDIQNTEVKRKKKSTTTFCVEIRPSGPFQKPFQVCEPSEPAKPASAYSSTDAANYYAAPNYPAPEQPKPQESYQPAPSPAYKPATQPKPAPAYSAPMKSYSTPSTATASKPMPYSSYRSKNADSGVDEHIHDHMHMMRMTHASEEEQNTHSSEATSEQQMRSSSYGLSSYGSPSYDSNSMFPVAPKEKPKGHNHNGLVITCQPNLAGYAHNVPSSFHHPSAVSYAYRSSTPKAYGRYDRYHYNIAQPQSYGGFQQVPAQRPAMSMFKPSTAVQSSQSSKPFSHSSTSFGAAYKQQMYGGQPPAAPMYPPQAYKPASSSYAPPPPPPPPSYAPPPQPPSSYAAAQAPASTGFAGGQATMPSSSFASSSQSYGSYSQPQVQSSSAQTVFAPSSGYGPSSVQAGYGPAPASQADFAPAPAVFGPSPTQSVSSPTEFAAAPGSTSSAAYGPAPPPPTVPQGPSYIPPATYRESEVETDAHSVQVTSQHQLEKEKQTVKKMQEISQQRVAGSQWATEIPVDNNSQNKKIDEHVGASQGWSSRTAETSRETGEIKRTEMEQETKNNEIDSV